MFAQYKITGTPDAYTIHACPEPLYPLILTAAAAAVTSIQSSRCIALLHKKQSFNEV